MAWLSKSTVISRYYLYRVTTRPGFHYPVYTLFLLWNGLRFVQIGLIAILSTVFIVGAVLVHANSPPVSTDYDPSPATTSATD